MKIVNCALLYADGDKYVWSVVTEDASEFPIDMDLVANGSIWENDGVKSVLTDGRWVAESSGGGEFKTVEVEFLLDGVSSAFVNGAFADPSGYVSPEKIITSSDRVGSVVCPSNGAPSVLTISPDFKFTAKQGNIIIRDATSAGVLGDGTVTIGVGGGK